MEIKELDPLKEKASEWVKRIVELSIDGNPYKYIADVKYKGKLADWYGNWNIRTISYRVMLDPSDKSMLMVKKKPAEKYRRRDTIQALIAECGMKTDSGNFAKYVRAPKITHKLEVTMVPLGKPIESKTYLIPEEEWYDLRHFGKVAKERLAELSDPSIDAAICITHPSTKGIAVTNDKDHLMINTPISIGNNNYMLITLIDKGTDEFVAFAAEEVQKAS